MADDRLREEVITQFFLDTCQLRRRVNENDVDAWQICAATTAPNYVNEVQYFTPLITGSLAEFYVDPILPCVGDIDIMLYCSDELAIPSGCKPPTQLPGEFDSHVKVQEIVNSEFPGYVYLVSAYSLTECVDDGKYNAVPCERLMVLKDSVADHGPALFSEWSVSSIVVGPSRSGIRLAKPPRCSDFVYCMRCLTWPPQAADWPTRHRNYGWPDSAAIDLVVRNGCDVVHVAHPLCRQDEWKCKRQWRLSFSRAEIVLLNSWTPVQQIVYHMLRVFMKTEQLTESANNSEAVKLCNYHIKTLMLWSCERKSSSWWTDSLNLVRICVELLHTLGGWLNDARCQHYFISNCNLFDRFESSRDSQVGLTANRLMSVTRARFSEWCIYHYMHECAELCHSSFSSLLWDPTFTRRIGELPRVICLQCAVIAWRRDVVSLMTQAPLLLGLLHIMRTVSCLSLSVRSCLWSIDYLTKTDPVLSVYFTAVVFLHVAHKTTQASLTDEMLDVLATTRLQSNDARRCLNARHSSVLSLSQAALLMKVVANNSRSTVQLIEIELAKAYLHRALRCSDSNRHSISCLAHVYLAVLYYTTGQYETALDHCTLVARSQDHPQCSSYVIQGELLPKVDDKIDSTSGLAVFYQYIRADALNEDQESRHVSVFTTALFARYLRIKFLSVTEFSQMPQTSLAGEIQRYRSWICNSAEIYVTDVMVFCFANRTKYPSNDRLLTADRGEIKTSILPLLKTSKLVQLLQQSAIEHLTTCRELHARIARSISDFVTRDFKALYAYKCGQYQRCLQLSVHNVCTLTFGRDTIKLGLAVRIYPELIQLMDDDIISLIGLTMLAVPSPRSNLTRVSLNQLSLSLYLMTYCQVKLRHSVTSLATTLDYIQLAHSKFNPSSRYMFDRLMLSSVGQKLLRYMLVNH